MSFKRLSNRFSKPDAVTRDKIKPILPQSKASASSVNVNGSERSLSIANGDDDQRTNYRQALVDFIKYLPDAPAEGFVMGPAAEDEQQTFESLQSLNSVRERSNQVFMLVNRGGQQGSLHHFDVDQTKLAPLVHSLVQVVKVGIPSNMGISRETD